MLSDGFQSKKHLPGGHCTFTTFQINTGFGFLPQPLPEAMEQSYAWLLSKELKNPHGELLAEAEASLPLVWPPWLSRRMVCPFLAATGQEEGSQRRFWGRQGRAKTKREGCLADTCR